MPSQSVQAKDNLDPFRVLTIDGGGMLGLYSAKLLHTLAKRFNENFHQQIEPDIGKAFDLICGTSTGAILACGLAAGLQLSRIQDLYIKKGPLIFPDQIPGDGFKLLKWAYKHRKKPAADASVLKKALIDCFKDTTLEQVFRDRSIALCIPAITATTNQPRVIKTPHTSGKHRDNMYTLVDTCLASSAAPIFFPLSQRKSEFDQHNVQCFVDGGLWANNPVLVGLIESLMIADHDQEIQILSVGTCDKNSVEPCAMINPEWGVKDWKVGVKIADMSISAQSLGHIYMSQFFADLLNKCGRTVKIFRIEENKKSPQQHEAIGLDRADEAAIRTMLSLAESDADWNYSKSISAQPGNARLLNEIFTNIPSLEPIDVN